MITGIRSCSACVVACNAENNIPTVGADQSARGRAMHTGSSPAQEMARGNPIATHATRFGASDGDVEETLGFFDDVFDRLPVRSLVGRLRELDAARLESKADDDNRAVVQYPTFLVAEARDGVLISPGPGTPDAAGRRSRRWLSARIRSPYLTRARAAPDLRAGSRLPCCVSRF